MDLNTRVVDTLNIVVRWLLLKATPHYYFSFVFTELTDWTPFCLRPAFTAYTKLSKFSYSSSLTGFDRTGDSRLSSPFHSHPITTGFYLRYCQKTVQSPTAFTVDTTRTRTTPSAQFIDEPGQGHEVTDNGITGLWRNWQYSLQFSSLQTQYFCMMRKW